ncbi:hypothetical protein BC834DRAFT_266879 [Gloeopeniophorella convolvens]|nr:hypothetical protein BC834DRAFT_266879 [Gloeopeniophorella convolvens]
MKSFVVLTAFVAVASAATVNTPGLAVVCQPLQLTWSPEGSTGPYFLSLGVAGQPTAPALKQFPTQDGTSYTWPKVDLPVGTAFTVMLKDSNGQQAFSAPATVQSGSDTSCVNGDVMEGNASNSTSTSSVKASPGVAAVTSGTSSAPSSTGTSSVAAASNAATQSPKSAVASSSSSGAPAPSRSASVKSNAAARGAAPGAAVGILGLISVAALLAA